MLAEGGANEINAGGTIRSFVTARDQTFFRVSSAEQSSEGGFLTATAPRSSTWAREALALPPENDASFIQEVLVPAGTRLQRSRALPLFGRQGGGEQFQLLQRIPTSNFGFRRVFGTNTIEVCRPAH